MEAPRTPSSRRIAGIAVIAFSSLAWWPAFTLGAWGTLFFPQVMSLWAVSTATFVMVALTVDLRRRWRWWALALLIPTAWMLLALEVTPGERAIVGWLGTAVTLFGAPAMMWILVRFAAPDFVEEAEPRDRVTVIAAVLVVVIGAFAVGHFEHRFFTCGDFTISGNSEPPGCIPGEPSLDVLDR